MNQVREEARQRLHAAINDYLVASENIRANELLSDWAMVVHMTPIENNGISTYGVIMSSHTSPAHLAWGLFHEGMRLLDRNPRPNRED